jgi:thymidylate synthase (FAD)
MSFAQESTRYCNYTNDKFGNELTFIEPPFYSNMYRPREYYNWEVAMNGAEKLYNDLIALGSTPQEARSVLPNSLKTEICVTGRLKDWYNFFMLRSDGAAHPQARELATPLLRESKERYDVFVGLKEVE